MKRQIATKDKILAAAKKLFVEHGFAGTSMGKIAAEAQINHSLIFHHFNNKEQLWVAVKQSIVNEANQQINTLPDINRSFRDFLKELFWQNIQFYRKHPDVVRMINWQRLEYQDNLKIGITLTAETQAWMDAFKHYQQQKDIHPKLKPEFIITLVLSIISSMALDPNVFISKRKDQQAYVDFCIEGLLKALI